MKKQKDINIPRKALIGIASAIAIIAVVLSSGKTPQALLFLIGIFCGVLIGRGFFEK